MNLFNVGIAALMRRLVNEVVTEVKRERQKARIAREANEVACWRWVTSRKLTIAWDGADETWYVFDPRRTGLESVMGEAGTPEAAVREAMYVEESERLYPRSEE